MRTYYHQLYICLTPHADVSVVFAYLCARVYRRREQPGPLAQKPWSQSELDARHAHSTTASSIDQFCIPSPQLDQS